MVLNAELQSAKSTLAYAFGSSRCTRVLTASSVPTTFVFVRELEWIRYIFNVIIESSGLKSFNHNTASLSQRSVVVCVCACVRACVQASVRACVRASVRACFVFICLLVFCCCFSCKHILHATRPWN